MNSIDRMRAARTLEQFEQARIDLCRQLDRDANEMLFLTESLRNENPIGPVRVEENM